MTESMSFKRPAVLMGMTTKVRTAHGNLYVTVNLQDSKPIEVFAILGKGGGCDSAYMEAVTRLISTALQQGIAVSEIVDQLRSISCHPYMVNGPDENSGPIDAIAQVLEAVCGETM